WVGMQAAHCLAAPAFELNLPALTHHRLFLFSRPPEELDLRYEGVKRHRPPAAGSVSLLPADSPAWVRSSGCKDELHLFLEPGLVSRVGAEAFDLDPARLAVPPLDGLDLPEPPRPHVGGGCRANRRRRGTAGRRVAGHRPGRQPAPTRPDTAPARAQASRHAPPSEAPRCRRVRRGAPRREPDP